MRSLLLVGMGFSLLVVGVNAGSGSVEAHHHRHVAVSALPAGEILVTEVSAVRTSARLDLYAMTPDGLQERLVARDAADAAVSRDGKQIAFVRKRAIWIMETSGAGQRQVAAPLKGREGDDFPAWAADGKTLYFTRHSRVPAGMIGLTGSIYAVRTDGTGLHRLTHAALSGGGVHSDPACHEEPSVSRDGQIIVYTVIGACGEGYDNTIAAVATDGRTVKLRVKFPPPTMGDEYVDATWAPKDAEIAYGVWDSVGSAPLNALYVSPANGGPPHRLTAWHMHGAGWPGEISSPAWSTDGGWLAFTRGSGCVDGDGNSISTPYGSVGDVWVIRSDGSGLHRLTTTGCYARPTFLPPAVRA